MTIPRTPDATAETPARLTVTFDRIGRTHNPPPLELGGLHERFWGGPTQQIGAYAKGFLAPHPSRPTGGRRRGSPLLDRRVPRLARHDRRDLGRPEPVRRGHRAPRGGVVMDALTRAAWDAAHDLVADLPKDIRVSICPYGSFTGAPAPLVVTVWTHAAATLVITAMAGATWASVTSARLDGTWHGIGVRLVTNLPEAPPLPQVHHYETAEDRAWWEREHAGHPEVTRERAAEASDLAHRLELAGAL